MDGEVDALADGSADGPTDGCVGGTYGIALLSKLPILHAERFERRYREVLTRLVQRL